MAEIQFKGITKRYPDGFEAVKAIDLDIADGEFMILVGPSGCGKSTALRMIAGLEDVSEGDLKAHVKSNLARYKVPRDIEFLDELPRNATGKVLKRKLEGGEDDDDSSESDPDDDSGSAED